MKKTTLLATLVALAASPVFAGDWAPSSVPNPQSGFSYDYIDADWIYQGFDDELENGNGWSVAGSKSITDSIFATASYSQLDTDIAGTNVDIDRIMIGLGGRIPLSNRIDLTANASAVYTDAGIEANAEEFDEWGSAVGLGLRIQVIENLELFTNANWIDSLNEGQLEATVGAILQLTDNLGLRVGGRFVDDSSQLFVGGRVSF